MDDFSDLNDDDFGFESNSFTSDFSSDLSSELSSDLSSSQGLEETDDFDQLRRSSARSETMYNDLSEDDFREDGDRMSDADGFSLNSFSPSQRIILAVLVVLNILMIGFALLVIAGVVGG